VIETEEGWKTPAELPMQGYGRDSSRRAGSLTPASVFGVPRGSIQRPAIHRPTVVAERGDRRYSNLQLGISHPHEDLGVIVGSHVALSVEGDTVAGSLSDLGAQLLLVRDGQDSIEPIHAAGTFRIWLRNGIVARYQVRLEGVLNVQVPSGRRRVEVRQVTDTTLKDVGTTAFEVPEPARLKLVR
jgi:hypothetical protein